MLKLMAVPAHSTMPPRAAREMTLLDAELRTR